jgi:WD domain, G-beta repeat
MKHDGPVTSVAFSPDGNTIATGSGYRTVQLWNTYSGDAIGPPLSHQETLFTIAFAPDGRTIVTAAKDAIRVWNFADSKAVGQLLLTIRNANYIASSPDGKTILTRSENGTRLWDVATGQPVGPKLQHSGEDLSRAFSPDGKVVVTGSVDNTVRLWRLPTPIDNDLDRVSAWIETMTGLEIDAAGAVGALDTEHWQERHDRLARLGGAPKIDSGWLFEPALYASDPCARARAWAARKHWSAAEAAFAEVTRARPLLSSAWLERGLFYANRSEPEKAVADFVRALTLGNRDSKLISEIVKRSETLDRVLAHLPADATAVAVELRFHRAAHLCNEGRFEEARALLAQAGSPPRQEATSWGFAAEHGEVLAMLGFSEWVSALRDKYQHTTNLDMANDISRYCVLAGSTVPDPDRL